MGAVVAIDALLHQRQVWRGRLVVPPAGAQPTGHADLDAVLPSGGWPEAALSELLISADGVGELQLLWPALARLSQAGERVVLVAPPYLPFAPAWRQAGVELRQLQVVRTKVPVGLLTPERDAALLFELARGRLEQVQLPAPVRAIALCADELPPFVPVHRELFDPRPQQAMPWEQLRERLRARLGEGAVHGVQVQADHRPECASLSPLDAPVRCEALSPGTALGSRPGWLLTKPVPLRGPMPQLLAGPERIESGWWDGGDVRRDYYRARLATGQCAWVFRPVCGEGVMLHGWFA